MALFSIFPDFPGFLLFSRQVKGYETKTLLSFGHINTLHLTDRVQKICECPSIAESYNKFVNKT